MAVLVPGALMKLLQHMNTDAKATSEHRSSLLQVIGIVPAIAGGDLYSSKGFYLRVSDSSHATYVSISTEENHLILSDSIQLGQFIHVERFEAATPVPILRGVKPIPGRHPCVGEPEDLQVTDPGTRVVNKSKVLVGSKDSRPSLEKEKISTKKPNTTTRSSTLEIKRVSLVRSSSSLSKQSADSVFEKKDAAFSKSISRSIPSSPTSCYSLPTSFEKFSNGVKQQVRKSTEKPQARLGLLERAASVLKATTAGKKASANNVLGSLPFGLASGPQALRKSWEGNMELKGKDALNSKSMKRQSKSEARSSLAPRRKPPSEEKMFVQEDNRVQTSVKKVGSILSAEDSGKSNKHQISSVKKSADIPENSSLGNLVKLGQSSRKLTRATTSWGSLPPSLSKLGKELIKYRNAAESAAIEALQEASAAETLLRCLSGYAEISSSAREDNPQPTVEQFLSLHSILTQAAKVAKSLTHEVNVSDPEVVSESGSVAAAVDHRKLSTAWVHAALATDVAPFSLYGPKHSAQPSVSSPTPVTAVAVKTRPSSSPSPAVITRKSKLPVAPITPVPTTKEWERGGGMGEAVDLARALREQTTAWFLGFVEKFLDADLPATHGIFNRDQVAGMLSQLKKVNDWLDMISRQNDEEHEESDLKDSGSRSLVGLNESDSAKETIERLRKKIYDYLLSHVESAAIALGGTSAGNPSAAATPSSKSARS